MPKTKKMIEQRKHKRFYVQRGTYAMLKYKPAVMGQIMNMSKDGLAIRYNDGEQQLSDSSVLDIFMTESSFYIEKLQVKTISDFKDKYAGTFWGNKVLALVESRPGHRYKADFRDVSFWKTYRQYRKEKRYE